MGLEGFCERAERDMTVKFEIEGGHEYVGTIASFVNQNVSSVLLRNYDPGLGVEVTQRLILLTETIAGKKVIDYAILEPKKHFTHHTTPERHDFGR